MLRICKRKNELPERWGSHCVRSCRKFRRPERFPGLARVVRNTSLRLRQPFWSNEALASAGFSPIKALIWSRRAQARMRDELTRLRKKITDECWTWSSERFERMELSKRVHFYFHLSLKVWLRKQDSDGIDGRRGGCDATKRKLLGCWERERALSAVATKERKKMRKRMRGYVSEMVQEKKCTCANGRVWVRERDVGNVCV